MTNDRGKSDRPIVPAKSPNKVGPRKQRDYGDPYTGTKAETLDTAKGEPTAPTVEADPTAEAMKGRGLTKGIVASAGSERDPERLAAGARPGERPTCRCGPVPPTPRRGRPVELPVPLWTVRAPGRPIAGAAVVTARARGFAAMLAICGSPS